MVKRFLRNVSYGSILLTCGNFGVDGFILKRFVAVLRKHIANVFNVVVGGGGIGVICSGEERFYHPIAYIGV